MANIQRNEMPVQRADIRRTNFSEVALGYTAQQAISEASRCINCKNKPCVAGCPVGISIPSFIQKVAQGNFEDAYQIISRSNSLPAVCGRVCPQESQCEFKCVRGFKGEPVAIGRLERFVADHHNAHNGVQPQRQPSNGHKVAVIGSGPSGLSCAGDLARKGYDVTVYEALHVAGGVLSYGIPEFRLPKSIVQKEVDQLNAMGVTIETNTVIGKTITVDELMENLGFEAVFVGSGAGLPSFMNVSGESLKGVYSANEFLTRVNLMKAYQSGSATPIQRAKHVVVVGGGNVAMDAARCARRLGSEVTVVYRRTEAEMPARSEEAAHAKEEGVKFLFLTAPIGIDGNSDGWASAMRCRQMKLSEPDASGRARPVPVVGSDFSILTDCVIVAIGTSPNPLIASTTKGLDIQKWGGIIADESTGATSKTGVYAGGDAVTGAATVILAMSAGKSAAAAIDKFITER